MASYSWLRPRWRVELLSLEGMAWYPRKSLEFTAWIWEFTECESYMQNMESRPGMTVPESDTNHGRAHELAKWLLALMSRGKSLFA